MLSAMIFLSRPESLLAPRRVRLSAAAAALLMLSACRQLGVQLPIPTDPPSELCSTGLFLPFTLAGDTSAVPAVWGVDRNGERLNVVWPNGWTAHEDQGGSTIVIADPGGRVVARTGDVIANAGGGGGPDGTHICSIR
jgi:hypothetical protein